MNLPALRNEKSFEDIKQINEYGQEYWSARELCDVLDYASWQNFSSVIGKAVQACENADNKAFDHFNETIKEIEAGKGAKHNVQDFELSRYACYLIVMNGDPRKEVIALGQTYFAIKARQQELSEDQKRLSTREEMAKHNKSLAEAAQAAGVKNFGVFQNSGYKDLYGGLDQKQIHERKGLKKSQKILDHMGSTELAANLFRATQADEKLRRENIQGEPAANQTHFAVGQVVRKTIEELGGTMPEDLPTPNKSIKQIQREQEKKKIS